MSQQSSPLKRWRTHAEKKTKLYRPGEHEGRARPDRDGKTAAPDAKEEVNFKVAA